MIPTHSSSSSRQEKEQLSTSRYRTGSGHNSSQSRRHPTPRSVVPVKVANIVVKIVEMLGYEVQLDSTTTTTKCFMDLKFHTTKHQATVNIRLYSESSNHGKKSARRILTLVIPKPDVSSRCCLSTDACNLSQGHASCKYKLQDEEGYNFKAKGKGDEFTVYCERGRTRAQTLPSIVPANCQE